MATFFLAMFGQWTALKAFAALLYAQRHNAVDDVVIILLESLDRLLPAHTRLCHHELDVLGFEASVIYLLAIILFFLDGLRPRVTLNCLTLIAISSVVVAGVIIGGLSGKLLCSRCLRLRVEVFDLSFTEDATVALLAKCASHRQINGQTHIQVLLDGDL